MVLPNITSILEEVLQWKEHYITDYIDWAYEDEEEFEI